MMKDLMANGGGHFANLIELQTRGLPRQVVLV